MPRHLPKEPVYARLAAQIKQKISSGEFPPGSRIPSDTAIGQAYGVAIMTVRSAIRILSEQGLLKRVHGSGTYVLRPDWAQASFTLEGLTEKINDKNNIIIKILDANGVEASPQAAKYLDVEPGTMILTLLRLVSHQGQPLLLNRVYLIFDPRMPIVESELEASSLAGLFSDHSTTFIKKVLLKIEPCFLSPIEAAYISTTAAMPAFKIRYTFFSFDDAPMGTGWFLTSMSNLELSSKIGIWDDE
jgi:GntR family transcriptional regulator